MPKIRIYELAKQVNMTSKDLIEILNKEFGLEVKNHMSVIEGEEANIVIEFIEELKEKMNNKGNTLSDDKSLNKSIDEKENKDDEMIDDEFEDLDDIEYLDVKFEKIRKKSTKIEKNKKSNNKQEDLKEDDEIGIVVIPESIKVGDFAKKIKKPASEVLKKLIFIGVMVSINHEITFEVAEKIAEQYNIILEKEAKKEKEEELINDYEDNEKDLVPRPPVVTVMGHVDHGKTSLLDAIRHSRVTDTEAGGITQHIGAYTVDIDDNKIVFLDTPGHEAFTAMRARGAKVTDIAILVVAADDGVMPQTIEAINHAKAANVPIIVAINKIDKNGANPDRVKQELTEYGLIAEDWGGDTICVPVSARTKEGIDNLLEMILLVAEMQELKANPNRTAKGTIIEAKLDKSRGPVATVLVQKGTLKTGDCIVAGTAFGKVRAMIDDKGKKVKSASPSIPVEVLGFSEVPNAGDIMYCVADEKTAREISEIRKTKEREYHYASTSRVSLQDLFSQIQEGKVKDLNIIVKADVQGSVEAIKQSLEKLSNSEVRVNVIHGGVGAITETDVTFASVSNALIIGFNVRPEPMAMQLAEKEKVEIKTYRIIYEAIDDITAAMKGMLEPEYKEVITARLVVRNTFKVSAIGTIAGCYVEDGKINRNNSVRVIRNGIVIYEGKLASLKRFKDDVKEVASGFECGLTIEKFNDIKEEDIIEAFTMEEIKRD
ncbi:bacterial translation initiation factor 2 (bIF-2) [Caloramator quimbayensis]|uniref:Translation initiation factor IF-2 n=2 Tax=Caloramator quimbayensis TaxID=1147123 RepID=A0A1T4XC23_9CLOT|nr:translation initiation factor IF-2 [Caloramator quimbayensis]SKA86989.1 bacterial translation initiation factor 2 (bIF-2) [Caloramator quimbayensis]